jgi:hypothetical protein
VNIVILDNILSAPTVHGLDLAASLVVRGFTGDIVISSATDLSHAYADMPTDLPLCQKRKILNKLLFTIKEP